MSWSFCSNFAAATRQMDETMSNDPSQDERNASVESDELNEAKRMYPYLTDRAALATYIADKSDYNSWIEMPFDPDE